VYPIPMHITSTQTRFVHVRHQLQQNYPLSTHNYPSCAEFSGSAHHGLVAAIRHNNHNDSDNDDNKDNKNK
jgi:hypothetical protein